MTRARSNALTGPQDPRYRSQAEISMYSELYKPYEMSDTLTSFLLKVFSNTEIMEASAVKGHQRVNQSGKVILAPKGKGVADQIYALYSSSGVDSAGDYQVNKKIINSIWGAVSDHSKLSLGSLQYTRVSLKTLVEFMQTKEPAAKYLRDFIYFKIGGSPTSRVYLNAKPEFAGEVVGKIKQYLTSTSDHGITAFKIAGPGAMAGRADTVVCYCKSKSSAQTLAAHMATESKFYNADLPGMTTRVAAGVAIGAEPAPQATGLGVKPEGYPESAQSFGTIRAELISGAVLNFNENKHIFGSSFDVFKRFVAVAFRCNGLDPENPGD